MVTIIEKKMRISHYLNEKETNINRIWYMVYDVYDGVYGTLYYSSMINAHTTNRKRQE